MMFAKLAAPVVVRFENRINLFSTLNELSDAELARLCGPYRARSVAAPPLKVRLGKGPGRAQPFKFKRWKTSV